MQHKSQAFKTIYVNPSRRDLIKQLGAIVCLGTTGQLLPASLLAADDKISATKLAGRATWQHDEQYETLRKALLWQVNTPARYPDVIVQVETEDQIRQALRFAADNDLQVVCRSSGHNTAGAVLRNGGMLLDVSALSAISVNAEKMTARVQPGLTMVRCYQTLADHNAIFPLAECHGVALGGYLLGGGFAPIAYSWGKGPACYAIISAEIILANGEKVIASKNENADLFWALRGAGPGFFSVVSAYRLKLVEHPQTIMRSTFFYHIDELAEVMAVLDELHEGRDERVKITVSLTEAAAQPGTTVASLNIIAATPASNDSEAAARALLRPYAHSRLSSLAVSKNTHQILQFTDLMYSPDRNYRNNSDNIWTNDSSALQAIIRHYENRPPASTLFMTLHHGHQDAQHRQDACYSSAGTHFLSSHLLWKNAADDEAALRWYAEFNSILQPYTTSHYVNQIDNANHPQRVRASFSSASWQGLKTVRNTYDPDNRFYSYLGYD